MNTTSIHDKSDEETEAGAATRFMQFLHHPEEHDGDGDQPDLARIRAMNDLTGSSIHVPIRRLSDKESAITVRLARTQAVTPKAKARGIAPWLVAVGQAHEVPQ